MKIPTLREFVGFHYSQLVHLVLLLVLLAECLAHTIIAAIAEYYKFYALVIFVPVLAGVLLCIRTQPFVEQFDWFPGGSVLVELVPYVTHMILKTVSICLLCDYLRSIYQAELVLENPQNYRHYIPPADRAHNLSRVSTARRNAVLLIVCSTLELVQSCSRRCSCTSYCPRCCTCGAARRRTRRTLCTSSSAKTAARALARARVSTTSWLRYLREHAKSAREQALVADLTLSLPSLAFTSAL